MKHNKPLWIIEKYIEFRKKHKGNSFFTKDVKDKIEIKNVNELVLLWEKYGLVRSKRIGIKKVCEFCDGWESIYKMLKSEIEWLNMKEHELKMQLKEIRKLKNNILKIKRYFIG